MKDNTLIQISGELFASVQQQSVFKDCKTFVDCLPKHDPHTILQHFNQQSSAPEFNLKDFIAEHFTYPPDPQNTSFNANKNLSTHIDNLWQVLSRPADTHYNWQTLIPLPHPYIVPGGRFREIYYWDSYFTIAALLRTRYKSIAFNMAKNLAYLIDTCGHIPNGNRQYYLSRSQPPMFACIIDALSPHLTIAELKPLVLSLAREYQFWMAGEDRIHQQHRTEQRVVWLKEGVHLNRYWDNTNQPRPESYREDKATYEQANASEQRMLYHNLRAACESGWDFSSRWLRDPHQLTSIYTSEIIPVDLNCLLYFMETVLGRYAKLWPELKGYDYLQRAACRRQAILDYCWNPQTQFFHDYCFTTQQPTATFSLAACYPLYFKLAQPSQAQAVATTLSDRFLYPGGLVTTLCHTTQQWDKPNGWAPLQWVAIEGCRYYGLTQLAHTIQHRWLQLNHQTFAQTGKMMEKYNVCDLHASAGGGEYPLQDGFGWTNAVFTLLNN